MTQLRNALVLVVAVAAITLTSCSQSDNGAADAAAAATADSLAAQATADSIALAESTMNTDSTLADAGSQSSTKGGTSWSSDLDAWVLSGTGSKTITLDGIAGEGELSAEGRSQLDLIAAILEGNPGVKAVIQGHSADGGKPAIEKAGSKTRAIWTKTKLVLGHDAVSKNIETEGLGATQPISGVDPKDTSNKRITVTFSK